MSVVATAPAPTVRAARATRRTPTVGRAALACAAAVVAVVSVGVLRAGWSTSGGVSTIGRPSLVVAAWVAAGLALAAGGLAALLSRGAVRGDASREPAVGSAASAAAVAWCAAVWAAWAAEPAPVRVVGATLAALLPAALLHLAVAVRGRPDGRFVVAYGLLGAVGLARALVVNPFLDPTCRTACDARAVVATTSTAPASTLGVALLVLTALVGALAAVVAALAARRVSWPRTGLLVLVALAGAGEVVWAAIPGARPVDGPPVEVATVLLVARSAVLVALGAGLVLWALYLAGRRRDVVTLAARLGAAPRLGALQDELSRALGDARVEVRFWLPHSHRWVGAGGQAVGPFAAGGAGTATITRGGEVVAAIRHDADLASSDELERLVGPAARVAIDSERMRAETLAQLTDLRASQQRLVAAGDAARRQLERDLHDGAQQRLIAASYALRLATPTEQTADWLAEVLGALEDLRRLAHGVFPAVLADSGLAAALGTLADLSGAVLDPVPDRRVDPAVELTAYLVVARALAAGAASARVSVRSVGDELVVTVTGCRAPDMDGLDDRVGALGGTLAADSAGVRAVLPCA